MTVMLKILAGLVLLFVTVSVAVGLVLLITAILGAITDTVSGRRNWRG